jgi:hypothetical protein
MRALLCENEHECKKDPVRCSAPAGQSTEPVTYAAEILAAMSASRKQE